MTKVQIELHWFPNMRLEFENQTCVGETSLTLRAVLNSSMSISWSSPAMLSNCLVTQSSQRASASALMVSSSAEEEEENKGEDEEENEKMKEVKKEKRPWRP